ncbi:MAG TPA: hypothetical protein VKV27_02995 [Solirubrobacteraceae bacterium]|nr:hypothetical protein [Solirubrobacteraceae bacterium]
MRTTVAIDPTKLLEAAREFAEHQERAGRPRPIWLRRAVSTAHYAVFRAICRQAAAHLVPHAPLEDQLRLARSFTHQTLKETCEWIAGRRGNQPQHARTLVAGLRSTAVAGVAAAFCDLQEARHAADYDHLAPFPKATVLEHVAGADRAIAALTSAGAAQRILRGACAWAQHAMSPSTREAHHARVADDA